MRARLLIASLILAGCGDNPTAGPGDGDGDGDADASVDAPVDAGCETRWAPDHVDPCELPATPEPAIVIAAGQQWTYDTTGGTLTDHDGVMTTPVSLMVPLDPPVRLLYVESLTIEATGALIVDGDHPVIIGAADRVDIAGLLDLTAKNEEPRAGSNPASCPADPPAAGSTQAGGSGGGGGGGSQGAGGSGGTGNMATANTGAGGAGGPALASAPATPRGGCPGAAGGDGLDTAAGGTGGGAVQVSAQVEIVLAADGVVNAGGGGGVGSGGNQGGGGGGGAGGYVRLEAPDIQIAATAAVTANGGGGGGGANITAGTDGGDGQPDLSGGTGGPGSGGDGAFGGGAGDLDGGTALDANRGAGGGGGAAGFVVIPAAFAGTGVISPAAVDPL